MGELVQSCTQPWAGPESRREKGLLSAFTYRGEPHWVSFLLTYFPWGLQGQSYRASQSIASQQDTPLISRNRVLNTARPELHLEGSRTSHAMDTTVAKQWAGEGFQNTDPRPGQSHWIHNAEKTGLNPPSLGWYLETEPP